MNRKPVGFRSKGKGKKRIVYPLMPSGGKRGSNFRIKAGKIHARRSVQARRTDEALKAKLAKTEAEWAGKPNRLDLRGIDYPEKGRVKGKHGTYKPVYAVYTKVGNTWVVQWKNGKYGNLFDSRQEAEKAWKQSTEKWQKAGVKQAGREPYKIVEIGTPEKLDELYMKHKRYIKKIEAKPKGKPNMEQFIKRKTKESEFQGIKGRERLINAVAHEYGLGQIEAMNKTDKILDKMAVKQMQKPKAKPQAKPISSMIWRKDIGHYGGLYVDIPKEHFADFKRNFPTNQFPRKAKLSKIDKTNPSLASEWKKKYPNSNGEYYELFFAERSKGLKHLDQQLYKVQLQKTREYKSKKVKPKDYMILRKLDGDWVNLYPEKRGGLPRAYETEKEASIHAKRMKKAFGLEYKIVPKEEALKHEIPKRWGYAE